jgi:regulator of nucleoside diphosphate kinase
MRERDVFVTEDDARKLRTLLVGVRDRSVRDREHFQQLDDELDRAHVVPASEIPADVVTMNSELALRDLDTGEEMVFKVVFPSEANADQHRISVLAPLGIAVLGYRAGDAIEWVVPGRTRRIRIDSVLYQPEAAGSARRQGDERR